MTARIKSETITHLTRIKPDVMLISPGGFQTKSEHDRPNPSILSM